MWTHIKIIQKSTFSEEKKFRFLKKGTTEPASSHIKQHRPHIEGPNNLHFGSKVSTRNQTPQRLTVTTRGGGWHEKGGVGHSLALTPCTVRINSPATAHHSKLGIHNPYKIKCMQVAFVPFKTTYTVTIDRDRETIENHALATTRSTLAHVTALFALRWCSEIFIRWMPVFFIDVWVALSMIIPVLYCWEMAAMVTIGESNAKWWSSFAINPKLNSW